MKHRKMPGGLYKYIFQVYPCIRLVVIAFTPLFELEWKKKKKYTYINGVSLVAQMVKNLPAKWETQVLSLGWEDPLEEEMATHSLSLPRETHRQRSLLLLLSHFSHVRLSATP